MDSKPSQRLKKSTAPTIVPTGLAGTSAPSDNRILAWREGIAQRPNHPDNESSQGENPAAEQSFDTDATTASECLYDTITRLQSATEKLWQIVNDPSVDATVKVRLEPVAQETEEALNSAMETDKALENVSRCLTYSS